MQYGTSDSLEQRTTRRNRDAARTARRRPPGAVGDHDRGACRHARYGYSVASHPNPTAGLWRLTIVAGPAAAGGNPDLTSKARQSGSWKVCYLQGDVDNFEETLQENANDSCKGMSITAAKGRLFIAGICTLQGATMEMAGQGEYGATSYRFDATGTGTKNGHIVDLAISVSGRYMRPCTDAEARQ